MIEFSTAFYIAFGLSLVSGVVGYYVGERGWSGVQNDLSNIKLDIANLKGSLPFHGSTTTVTAIPVVTANPAGPSPVSPRPTTA